MNEEVPKQSYPLLWPGGWPRTSMRKRSRFGTWQKKPSIDHAVNELMHELHLMGARDVVISSDLVLRNDGLPRSGQSTPRDTGVAVYFKRKGQSLVIPCDTFDLPGCNLYAVSRTVNALRQMERDGCGAAMERAFTGYKALPEFATQSWRSVMQLHSRCDWDTVVHQYRHLAKLWHPDNQQTGSEEKYKKLANAYEEAKKEYQMENTHQPQLT